MEDCYYFYTAVCRSAETCRFRHVVRFQDNAQLCRYYSSGSCTNPKCKFKHNYFGIMGSSSISSSNGSSASGSCGDVTADTFAGHRSAQLPEKRQELCVYHFHGRCRLGKNCKFVHKDAELPVAPVSSMEVFSPSIPTSSSCDNPIKVGGKHDLEKVEEGVPPKSLKSEEAKSILSRYSNSTLAAKAKQEQEDEALEIAHSGAAITARGDQEGEEFMKENEN